MQIALGREGKEVDLWCDHLGTDEKGYIKFSVINGGWVGYYKDNEIYVKGQPPEPVYISWAGIEHGDYNDAMSRIREQINAPNYVMLPIEEILSYSPLMEEMRRENEKYGDNWDDDVPF
jgi:hypothetical protein